MDGHGRLDLMLALQTLLMATRHRTPVFVSSGVSGASTSAVTINTTGATLLVAIISSEAATPTMSDSVGGNTNAWNYLTLQTSTNNKTLIAYAYAGTGGGALYTGASHVITPAGTVPSCVVYAFSNTGTTSAVLNASNGAQQQAGTTVLNYTVQAGSITPTTGSIVVIGIGNNGTFFGNDLDTLPSGFTGELKQSSGATNEIVGGCYKLNDAGSAENPSWTVTLNGFSGVVIAAFK